MVLVSGRAIFRYIGKKIPKKEAQDLLEQRLEEIAPTGDDGTLAEREGIGCYCAG
ncbi:MAG: hypothetical protein MUO64_20990 [Anaerolineales bacterium]|jgi:hypothetical protein|nr:hypothetical protein [Anaerolineales bacterium]